MEDKTHMDIQAYDFWYRSQEAFFDVLVFYPNASSYCNKDSSLHHICMSAIRREYREKIREVDHGAFTPLFLTTTGGIALECEVFYKKLAKGIAEKQKLQYPAAMN